MRERYQPKLYAILIVLGVALAYLIAFVIKNSDKTSIDFVFGKATTSLIWVILLCLAIGLLAGVLLSQLYRRGGRDKPGKPGDAVGDLPGRDEAVGEAGGARSAAPSREEV
jgi:uncharacterized integral membrane protein